MSKKFVMVLLLICILLLSSCSLGGSRKVIFDDSDKKADARMEQLLETIKNKDKDAFKAMFSKQALKEANDFDGGMEYLFGFFQGNVDSWKQERFTSETSSEYGKKSEMLITWYKVATDPKGQDNNKWWVTGFNPKYQNVEANELTATYTVDFSGKKSCIMLLLNQRITWPIKRNGQFQNTINIY